MKCPKCDSSSITHSGDKHKCKDCGATFGPEHKHLPGKHDQQSHAGDVTSQRALGGTDSTPGNKASHEEVLADFKKNFPVTKDLGSLRAKGKMQEDIVAAAEKFAGGMERESVAHHHEASTWAPSGDHDINSYFSVSKNGKFGTFEKGEVRGSSIPSFKLGFKSESDWNAMKDYLQSKRLIR